MLYEKYDNDKMIITDDDENEEDDTPVRFVLLHLTNEMKLFRDSLANLMQRTLK